MNEIWHCCKKKNAVWNTVLAESNLSSECEEEEGRSSSRQGKYSRENVSEVIGREQKSSKFVRQERCFQVLKMTSVFLNENYHVISKWN